MNNFTRSDSRGTLHELFRGAFRQCNMLTMKNITVWGNHYHKETTEWFYVVKGKLTVERDGKTTAFKGGDQFKISPGVRHTIYVKEDAQCMVLYSKEFDEENPDIYVI